VSVRDLWTRGDASYELPIEKHAKARYRYTLTRELTRAMRSLAGPLDGTVSLKHETTCLFVMLNPSTATHLDDDPTIRRCLVFAHGWGYSRLVIANLFAWRSTDRRALRTVPEPTGDPENLETIFREAQRASLVVCAWGRDGSLLHRGAFVAAGLRARGVKTHALRLLANGEPEHPLYLPASLEPRPWPTP
jgi:hypothetical protein